MINWIIKFLGGILKEDYSLLNTEYENQREIADTLRGQNQEIYKRLEAETTERKYLQELLFKNSGIIPREEGYQEQENNLQPIKTSPERWSSLRGKIEKDDLARAIGAKE